MKNFVISTLCVLLAQGAQVLLAVGPSKGGTDRTKNLIVGSEFAGSIGFAPFETVDKDPQPDNVIGFDASVASEIANRLGFPGVTFQQAAFQDLLPVLTQESSPLDIVIAAMSITQQNQEVPGGVSFVNYASDSLALVFNNEAEGFKDITDPATALVQLNGLGLPQSKIRIGVLGGSRQSAIITENNGTAGKYANLEAVVSLNNTLEELVEGLNSNTTLDALFIDGPTAQALLLGLSETGLAPDSSIRVVQNVVDETASQVSKGLGIAVPSKDCQLYVNIQKAITDMINDGTLARLRQEFRLPAVFTPVTAELAPVGCTLKPTINSNAIANYIFTNYCPRTVIPETTAVGPTA